MFSYDDLSLFVEDATPLEECELKAGGIQGFIRVLAAWHVGQLTDLCASRHNLRLQVQTTVMILLAAWLHATAEPQTPSSDF